MLGNCRNGCGRHEPAEWAKGEKVQLLRRVFGEVRGHGLRRAKYRGLDKLKLQNYFIAAACNVKRWIRREIWKLGQAVSAAAAQGQVATQS